MPVIITKKLLALLGSWPILLAFNVLFKPLLLCAVIWLLFPNSWNVKPSDRVLTFLAVALLLNSRLGHAVESLLVRATGRCFQFVRHVLAD